MVPRENKTKTIMVFSVSGDGLVVPSAESEHYQFALNFLNMLLAKNLPQPSGRQVCFRPL